MANLRKDHKELRAAMSLKTSRPASTRPGSDGWHAAGGMHGAWKLHHEGLQTPHGLRHDPTKISCKDDDMGAKVDYRPLPEGPQGLRVGPNPRVGVEGQVGVVTALPELWGVCMPLDLPFMLSLLCRPPFGICSCASCTLGNAAHS